MTITTYTDKEIALQKRVAELERELSDTDIALEECKMDWSGDVTQIKAEHKVERDTLRQQLAAATQLAQLNGEIAAELKADKLALEALIEASKKQEPVAYLEMKYEGGHEYLAETFEGAFNSFPVFAAPVVADDVLKDALKKIADAAFKHGLSLVKTADGFDLLRLGTATAGMGGAA